MKSKSILSQGAEAIIIKNKNEVLKFRLKKSYRIPQIDDRIRKLRTRNEGKLLEKASKIVNIPKIKSVNEKSGEIFMEFIYGKKLSTSLDDFSLELQKNILYQIGIDVGRLHDASIIHADLTTSNLIYTQENVESKIYFIDFGLGYISNRMEDKAVDLHLLKQALEAKHFKNHEDLFKEFTRGYLKSKDGNKVISRLIAVEKRGRYKDKY